LRGNLSGGCNLVLADAVMRRGYLVGPASHDAVALSSV
jgi:hypothetical protein